MSGTAANLSAVPIGRLQTEGDLRRFIEDVLDGSPYASAVRSLLSGAGERRSWGAIAANGTVLAGSGDFTCARTGAGQYTVTWVLAKTGAAYAIDATPDDQAGFNSMGLNWRNRLVGSFGVTTFTEAPLAAADCDWCFIVLDAQ